MYHIYILSGPVFQQLPLCENAFLYHFFFFFTKIHVYLSFNSVNQIWIFPCIAYLTFIYNVIIVNTFCKLGSSLRLRVIAFQGLFHNQSIFLVWNDVRRPNPYMDEQSPPPPRITGSMCVKHNYTLLKHSFFIHVILKLHSTLRGFTSLILIRLIFWQHLIFIRKCLLEKVHSSVKIYKISPNSQENDIIIKV